MSPTYTRRRKLYSYLLEPNYYHSKDVYLRKNIVETADGLLNLKDDELFEFYDVSSYKEKSVIFPKPKGQPNAHGLHG